MQDNIFKNYVIIDIETIPDETVERPEFDESSVKVGNLKNPEKINEKIEAARSEFNEGLNKKMSVGSDYCRILSIGYILCHRESENYEIIEQGVLFDEKGDGDILKRFNFLYKVKWNSPIVVGWNSKYFDIPVIWKRSILNGESAPFRLFEMTNKYQHSKSIDLMHVWNNGDRGKLKLCCKTLGIPCKQGLDSSMIYSAYKEGRYDEIKRYNLSDCVACHEILKLIGGEI